MLWYVSLAAIAFRFGQRETFLAAGIYAASYVALAAALGQLVGHLADVVVRVAYIGFVGAVGGALARESEAQARGKASMRGLAEASRRIAEQLEPERTLEAAVREARGLVGADRGAVYLLQPDGGLACAQAQGVSQAFIAARQRVFRELPGYAVLQGQPSIAVEDAQADPRLDPIREAVRAEGIRSYAAVPLVVRGRTIGLMTLYRDRVQPFTPEEVALAASIAGHVGVAVANARLVDELRETLSLLGATLESTADGILVVDPQGKVTSANRKFAELWRIPPQLLEARDDQALLRFVLDQLEDPEAFLQRVRALYDDPEASTSDELRFKDGRVFERYSQPQRLAGRSVGRVWSFRDVTAQRRGERERIASLERQQELERLREVDRFKTQFLNIADHELGTPLTPVRTQVYMLQRRLGALTPEQRKAVDVIDRNMVRLQGMVKDLLESARIQAGKLPLDRRPADLNRLVMESVETFQAHAAEQGVTLSSNLTPDLPVDADAKRLHQVLVNLLSNAVKFTAPGGHVEVATRRGQGEAEVRVRDTGAGLSPDQMARLFQPFTQVHEGQRTEAGTGLGLYISKGIVEQHGGRIWVESEGPGKGAAFCFTLPSEPGAPHRQREAARSAA